MRLGSCCGGGARVCMRWDSRGGVRGGRSESEWVGIGRNRGFSDKYTSSNLEMSAQKDICRRGGTVQRGCSPA